MKTLPCRFSLPKHAPRWIAHLFSFAALSMFLSCAQQTNEIVNVPQITDVSAMCTEEGITAQLMFDGAFNGKVYSNKYSMTHECVYYNSYGEIMILFTIPNYMCGTRLSRDGQNVVNHIENEVYVQFDKDTQNVEDKRYLFICDLSHTPTDFSGTVKPQTIIVQTIEPTRIFVTQTGGGSSESVVMSIADGDGPFLPPVSRALKLGDVVTLVVQSTQPQTGADYRMFVHSCYAADGTGGSKVELIDRAGCTVRPKVVGPMHRTRSPDGKTVYYARLQAFKFPSSDDVYFSCSVDICSSCNFAEICPSDSTRARRALMGTHPTWQNSSSQSSEDSDSLGINEIQLHDYVRIMDEDERLSALAAEKQASSGNNFCFSPVALAGIMATFGCLSLALIALTVFLISIVNRSSKNSNSHSERNYSSSVTSSTRNVQRLSPPDSRWHSFRDLYHSMWNYDENSPDKTAQRCTTATTSMSRNRDVR